jgi:hypothetical protein
MSADNWTTCPKCSEQKLEAFKKRLDQGYKKLAEAYGKVESDEYLKLVHVQDKLLLSPPEIEETLREDYQQGILDSEYYYCDYHAKCTECGWVFKYNHKQALNIKHGGKQS